MAADPSIPTDTRSGGTRREHLVKSLVWSLKLFALSFLFLEVSYLILGNLFLGLGGLKRTVSQDPKTFAMEYDSAWTFWPGHARTRGFRITGQDARLQWMLSLDDATMGVELGELFEKRFHVTHVRGQGMRFRLRFLLTPTEAADPDIRALPPIPGYTDPPLRPIGPIEPDPSDADYNLWTARLDAIDTDVRDIWIHTFRFSGDVGLKGQFFFRPLRTLDIKLPTFDVRSGEFFMGEHAALSEMKGSLQVKLGPLDPVNGGGLGILCGTSVQGDIHAKVPGFSFVKYLFEEAPDFGSGSGTVDMHFDLDRGTFKPGTEVKVAAERVEMSALGLDGTVDVDASYQVDDHSRGEVIANIHKATLHFPKDEAPAAELKDTRFTLETPSYVLAPWTPDVYAIDLKSLRIHQMRILQRLTPAGLQWRGGSAEIRTQLERRVGEKGRGTVHADLWRGALKWQELSMEGSFGADFQIEALDRVGRSARLRGSLGAGEVTFAHEKKKWSDWWARFQLKELTARLQNDLELHAIATLKMRDVKPFMGMLASMDAVPEFAADLFDMEGAAADLDFDADGTMLAFGVKAKAGPESVTGRLIQRGAENRGAFLIRKDPLSAGVSLGADGADISLLAGDDWLKEQLAKLRGDAGKK